MWDLDATGVFSVASARLFIDAKMLMTDTVSTRWNRFIPIKVNVFIWRLALNKIPSRVNLDKRGLDIGSLLCPICSFDVETVNHLFFSCSMAFDLWGLVARWWDMDLPCFSCISEWWSWIDSTRLTGIVKQCLDAVASTMLWTIWNFRNRQLFDRIKPVKTVIWDLVVSQSFFWINARYPKFCGK